VHDKFDIKSNRTRDTCAALRAASRVSVPYLNSNMISEKQSAELRKSAAQTNAHVLANLDFR
jgi:hypothetical protein